MMLSPLLTVYTTDLLQIQMVHANAFTIYSIRLTCEEQLPSLSANTELQSAEVNCQWPPSDRHLPWWSAWTSSVVEKLMRKNIYWFCLSINMYCTLIYNWTYLEIPPLFSVSACFQKGMMKFGIQKVHHRSQGTVASVLSKTVKKVTSPSKLGKVQATPYQTLISSKIRWGSLSNY